MNTIKLNGVTVIFGTITELKSIVKSLIRHGFYSDGEDLADRLLYMSAEPEIAVIIGDELAGFSKFADIIDLDTAWDCIREVERRAKEKNYHSCK